MRHEIADTYPWGYLTVNDFIFSEEWEKEEVHTIADAKDNIIVDECDYTAFAWGFGILLAIALFALDRMII